MENEAGEEEMSEKSVSDMDVSSSEDDLMVTVEKQKVNKAAEQYADEDSDPEEEQKEPPKRKADAGVKEIANLKKLEKGEIEVDFQYVCPSPAYYHNVKALLNAYLDGDHNDTLDYIGLTDHICERASIGQMVVSPMDADKDPELMPELNDLPDDQFEKAALKYYAERDVFAFSSILSLTYKGNQKKLPFLGGIYDYTMKKAEKYCSSGKFQEFKQLMATKNVGLLFAERFLNLPVEVVPPMHTELPADLEFTKVQEEITDPKEFNYSHLLILSKFTVPQGSGDQVA